MDKTIATIKKNQREESCSGQSEEIDYVGQKIKISGQEVLNKEQGEKGGLHTAACSRSALAGAVASLQLKRQWHRPRQFAGAGDRR